MIARGGFDWTVAGTGQDYRKWQGKVIGRWVSTSRRAVRGQPAFNQKASLENVPPSLSPLSLPPSQTMQRAHLPTPPQSPSARQLSIEPIGDSLALLSNLTAFYQQERYWTHHTRAALESALASTVKGTITLSADVDDVDRNSSSPRSSTAGFTDDSDYASVKAEPLTPKMKSMDLQQRRRNRKKNNLRLKLGGITPPILRQQGRPSQRILEMFAELVESRMESCERVTNMVKRYHRDHDLQVQRVV